MRGEDQIAVWGEEEERWHMRLVFLGAEEEAGVLHDDSGVGIRRWRVDC
jgi:hypothetical protein